MVEEQPEPARIRVRRRVGYGPVQMPDGSVVQEGEETEIWEYERTRSDFEPIEAATVVTPSGGTQIEPLNIEQQEAAASQQPPAADSQPPLAAAAPDAAP